MDNKSVVGNPSNWRYGSSRRPSNTNSLVSSQSHTSRSWLHSQFCNPSSASSAPSMKSKLI